LYEVGSQVGTQPGWGFCVQSSTFSFHLGHNAGHAIPPARPGGGAEGMHGGRKGRGTHADAIVGEEHHRLCRLELQPTGMRQHYLSSDVQVPAQVRA